MELTSTEAGWKNEAWEEGKQGRSYVIFREDVKHDKFASEREGRPVYKSIVLVEKIVPGDQTLRPVRPLRERDKEDFPIEWARFQQKQSQQIPGTPLGAVTWLSRSQVAEMNALQIQTVEQLATLPDSVASKVMGFYDLRRKAESFLKASQDSAFTTKLETSLKEKDEKIDALSAQVAELKALVEGKQGKQKAL